MTIINSLLDHPLRTLQLLLLMLPGRLLALSMHEFSHAWVAYRCGDATAKKMGRMTVNPLKHIDPVGMLLMLLVGFGWAKPVPVDPRNYRSYRRDDLLVSLAGVTMNLIMFLLSMLLMGGIASFALGRIPTAVAGLSDAPIYRTTYMGQDAVIFLEGGSYYYQPVLELMRNLPYASDFLIAPVFGEIPGYLYQMLGFFAVTNLVLCIFNLIPMPPLDGYHVLNDLILKRDLFADPRTARIATGIMFVLVLSGVLGRALGLVDTQILSGCGSVLYALIT